ncbi:hypothetical protein HD806DRAFT_438400 [Xylariaceae sp. AK1471]|nr:hypothetical protein HD806DRAFT_438400 [Xylariaceae sp. AK1471]
MFPKMLPRTPKPSQSSHGRDDDTRSLTSVPSLTGSGSTLDTASVLSESSVRHTTHISFNMSSSKSGVSTCVHSFIVVKAIDPQQYFICQVCRSGPHWWIFECNYCTVHYCRPCYNSSAVSQKTMQTSSTAAISNPRKYGSNDHFSSGRKDMSSHLSNAQNLAERLKLVDQSNPHMAAETMRRIVGTHATSLMQTAAPMTMHSKEPFALDNESSRKSYSICQTDKENVVVEAHDPFPVNILMAGHDRVQLIDASECDGDICYVSKELMESYNAISEAGKVCITWRKLDGDAFTHTWCEMLERSRIIGEAHLILGRGRQRREWNDCETVQDVIELTRTRLPPSQQHAVLSEFLAEHTPKDQGSARCSEATELDLAFMTAHKDIEDLSEGVSDGEYSSASSSNESYDTARGLIQDRKDQIIRKIVLMVTQWLQYQFIYAHKAANETTTGTFESGGAPSGTSKQLSQGQAKAAGKRKRKLSESNDDEGEDDGDDNIIPPHVETANKGKAKETLRFACPYFKYNPTKYKEWPVCPGPGWPDVHRVKEHLYRRHRQAKFRCVRCWVCFEVEQNYIDHQRATMPCQLGEKEPIEGFDADQERQLRSRKKKSHAISEVDKWIAVFQILFPHVSEDKIPSPFYDYDQFPGSTTHTYETLSECEQYVLREIPLRLREILVAEFDRDFQIIEQSLKRRAIESTSAIIASLFQEFRNLYQQDTIPITSSGPSTLQGHAGPSSTQALPSWFDSLESNRIFLDPAEFDFDFAFAADGSLPLFDDVQLEDIPRPSPESCALKQSDSGYESNNPERPNEKVVD